jgi:glycosyltransferase involved in cell wall biosynthesis
VSLEPAGRFRGSSRIDRVLLQRAEGVVQQNRHDEGELPVPFVRRPAQPRVSVVIPAMNEAENLPFVLPRIPAAVHEVILVDGCSTDNTVGLATALLPGIRIVAQEGQGKGAALRSGFAAATGDVIVMLDADCSTDPAEIPLFVGALLAGADFVKGSRFLLGGGTADMPIHRQLGIRAFVLLTRILFGARYTDLCYGYNAFWADVVDVLQLSASGFEVETMMNIRAHRVGLRIAEVPSFEYRRKYGVGNLRTFADGWRVLKTILAERRGRAQASRDTNARVRPHHFPEWEPVPELQYSRDVA